MIPPQHPRPRLPAVDNVRSIGVYLLTYCSLSGLLVSTHGLVQEDARTTANAAAPLTASSLAGAIMGDSDMGGGLMAVDRNNMQPEQPVPESYEELLDDYSHFAPPAANEVLQGTVLSITGKDVIIDFGYKSEGIAPLDQFQTPTGEITVQPGDVVDVMVEHGEQQEGYVLLSHTRAARLRIWDNLERAYQEQLILSGRVLGRVKGGLAVDVGIEAFMPGSQADPRPVHNLDSFIGQDIPVKIIKLNRRRGNVVVSRKLAVEEEITARKSSTLEHLAEGSVVTGVVKNLTEYGAFIDLGGIDGLLHVTDMSYGRITHPSEVLHVGDQVTVKVLKFDRGKERVSLGIKQLEPDPWERSE